MKIVFMGTPEFAVASLDRLYQAGHQILAVITAPDKLGGRGMKELIQSDIKKFALAKKLPLLQPKNLKNSKFQSTLSTLNADLFVVVAFRMLPESIWNMPRLGTINLHASLLPKYRGAAPINWAIIRGESKTGVTVFKLSHAIDTGDIILQHPIDIDPNENVAQLYEKMKLEGADVLLQAVEMLEHSIVHYIPQKDTEASSAPKIFHETCEIDFSVSVKDVHNHIRGLSPFPGAWCNLYGKETKILKAEYLLEEHNHATGEIIRPDKKHLYISCKDGYISILQLKPEGKKLMQIQEYLNGLQQT